MTWGIENWNPVWHTSADALAEAAGNELRELLGTRLRQGWLLWDLDEDTWWNDAPVVLEFENTSLAVCVKKLDELSITWDRIRLDRPVDLDESQLTWRTAALPEIQGVEGHTLEEIRILERDLAETRLFTGWALHGVEFEFGDRVLTVTNGLDENRLGSTARREAADRVARVLR